MRAGTTGSIALSLTNFTGGAGATGGCMQVYDASQVLAGEDCTGAAGVYTVGGLADGNYRVQLANFTGAAATQWYGPAATFAKAGAIAIAAGTNFTGAYRVLEPYAVVGRVVDGSGQPISGATVTVWTVPSYAGTYQEREKITTGADGTFVTKNDGLYPNLWFRDVAGMADKFPVTAINQIGSPTVMPDTVMSTPEARITGVLTPPSSFVSDSVCVVAYEATYMGYPLSHFCGHRGDAFSIRNLQAGSYALRFIDSGNPDDLSTAQADFWGGGTIPGAGWRHPNGDISTTVSAGTSTAVDIGWGGTLSATVSVAAGKLAGGCMDVYTVAPGPVVMSDCAPVGNSFSVDLGSDGLYKVKFRGFIGAVDSWYSGTSNPDAFLQINMSSGASKHVAQALTPWGKVSGAISLPAGVDPANGCMLATEVGGGGFFDQTCTDPATGLYSLSVPPGDYHLQFFTSSTDAGSQWYDNAASVNDAKTVTVAGATVTVNAQLAQAGQISGNLTVAAGAPAAGACVNLYELDGDHVAGVCADGSGHYALDSLPAGDYKLHVVGYGSWAGQWYGGSAVMSGASIITVRPGDVLTANTTLNHSGTIAGTVTAPGGQPALGGCIEAYTEDGAVYDQSCVDGSGRYSLDVPAGNYELLFTHFHDSSSRALASQWFGGGRSYVAAMTVAVVQGQVVNANAGLALGGTLTGTSTVADTGAVALNGCVAARDTDTRALIDFSCVDGSGAYDMHLAPGSYLLQFGGFDTPAGTPLLTTWYDAAPAASLATPVIVTVGATMTVPYSRVLSAGSVYGKVVLPPGAAMDGTVEAYDQTTGAFIASVAPGSDGAFLLDGLPTDRALRLLFANFSGAANMWFVSAPTFNSASSIWAGNPARSVGTATLAAESKIVGTFPSPPGFVGTNECVTAWHVNGGYVTKICGHAGEAFSLNHLPMDGYQLEFTDDYGHFAEYSTSGDWSTPSTISVTPGGTVDLAMPTITISSTLSVTWPGEEKMVSVSANPSRSGLAEVWVQYEVNGPWERYYRGAQIEPWGTWFTFSPGGWMAMKMVLDGVTSNTITFTPAVTPAVTLSGSASFVVPGTAQLATVSASPAWSGVAELWVQSTVDGPWVKSARTVQLTNGTGSFTVYPSSWTSMRVVFMGVTTAPITFTPLAPVGALQSVSGANGQVAISGWAVDADAPTTPLMIDVQLDGWKSLTADQANAAGVGAVPGAGANHGFVGSWAVPAGEHTLCVYVKGQGAGGDASLGCRTVTVIAPPSYPPVGALQSVTVSAGQVSISGWAVDADASTTPLMIDVQLNGWKSLTANGSNPAGDVAVPGAGANHGFAGSWTVPAGTYTLCVYAKGQGGGGDTSLGCRTVVVPAVVGSAPVGALQTVSGANGQVSISGWAVDADAPTTPLALDVQLNGWKSLTADQSNAAGEAAVSGAGASHGFVGSWTLPAGTYNLCVYAKGQGGGGDASLGCRTVTVTAAVTGVPPVGALQTVSGANGQVSISGWAVDADAPTTPLALDVQLNGWKSLTANGSNPAGDVAVPGAGANHGFVGSWTLPAGTYNLCVYVKGQGGGGDASLGCRTVTVTAAVSGVAPVGALQTVSGANGQVSVSGWAVDADAPTTPLALDVQLNGWKSLTANGSNPAGDVAVPGAGANHGFAGSWTLPAGTYTLCVYVKGQGGGGDASLGCRTVTVTAAVSGVAPVGALQTVSGANGQVSISGWAVDADAPTTPLALDVQLNGWKSLTANGSNPAGDVAVPGAGANHGFAGSWTLPAGTYTLCVYVKGQGGGGDAALGCRQVPVTP